MEASDPTATEVQAALPLATPSHSITSAQPLPQCSSTMLGLPKRLRIEVYAHVIEDLPPIAFEDWMYDSERGLSPPEVEEQLDPYFHVPLGQVCHLIRTEMMELVAQVISESLDTIMEKAAWMQRCTRTPRGYPWSDDGTFERASGEYHTQYVYVIRKELEAWGARSSARIPAAIEFQIPPLDAKFTAPFRLHALPTELRLYIFALIAADQWRPQSCNDRTTVDHDITHYHFLWNIVTPYIRLPMLAASRQLRVEAIDALTAMLERDLDDAMSLGNDIFHYPGRLWFLKGLVSSKAIDRVRQYMDDMDLSEF